MSAENSIGTGERLQSLLDILKEFPSAVLACSGGLDSTFLLKALGFSGVRALAVTGVSDATPQADIEHARRMARETGVEHREIQTAEMAREDYVRNFADRCYHCKDILFSELNDLARREGFAAVLDGSNLDDAGDYRPGMKAAKEHGVRSPLLEAGLSKADIREAARALGIELWDRPSSPCLASRFPYGVRITPEGLQRVARAEDFLRSRGFGTLRVRDHSGLARIEVRKEELMGVVEDKDQLAHGLRELGFDYVCLDLEGFSSGSLNRVLRQKPGGGEDA